MAVGRRRGNKYICGREDCLTTGAHRGFFTESMKAIALYTIVEPLLLQQSKLA